MLLALAQCFLDPCALERGREHVRERLDEQHVGAAELPRLRVVGAEHTPGPVAALHDHANAAHDVVCFEVGRDGESDFGGEILDDQWSGGIERVARQRAAVGRDQRSPDRALAPSLAGAQQQAAVLRPKLENLAELDVEPAGQKLGRGVEQVDGELPGERLDRKSTRLNSSHRTSSYAVFCLKKKSIWRGELSGDAAAVGIWGADGSGGAAGIDFETRVARRDGQSTRVNSRQVARSNAGCHYE